MDSEKRLSEGLPEVQARGLELETKTNAFNAMPEELKIMTMKERLLERETRLLEKLEVVQAALRILAENPEFEKQTNVVLKADEQPEL